MSWMTKYQVMLKVENERNCTFNILDAIKKQKNIWCEPPGKDENSV